MTAFTAKVSVLAPAARKPETSDPTSADADKKPDVVARPVEGPVDMADLRRRVMARHPVVRAYLAR